MRGRRRGHPVAPPPLQHRSRNQSRSCAVSVARRSLGVPRSGRESMSNPEKQMRRVGDWVEVRPLTEIMATLDANGRLDGMPFMPEMVRYCGQRFQIVKSAHKTCDPTGQGNLRRLSDAVHLPTRCDGSGHDGCEARCLLFWKTAWLKCADGPGGAEAISPEPEPRDLERLCADTRYASNDDSAVRYRCQATEIVNATTALGSRDLRQYVADLASGNVAPSRFVSQFTIAVKDLVASRAGRILSRMRRPQRAGSTAAPEPSQAAETKTLEPGEFVQVRPVRDIARTLDGNGKNRGLSYEREMERYSGATFRVGYRPRQIIDERTGRKIRLGNDCIVLEGLVCAGLDNRGRLFCPRSSYLYWREAWLRRAGDEHHTPASN